MKKYFAWFLCLTLLFSGSLFSAQAVAQSEQSKMKQKNSKPVKQKSVKPAPSSKTKNVKAKTNAAARKANTNKQTMTAKAGFLDQDAETESGATTSPTAAHALDGFNSESLSSIMLYIFVPILALMVLMLISMWKIFVKAGREGWESLVPILSLVRIIQIAKMPMWSLIICFIPYVNAIFGFWFVYALAKSFNKSVGYSLGLLFLPFIFYPHLAFSNASYANEFESPQGPTGFRMAS